MDSYASFIRSENVQDWKAGLTYGVASNITLDAGYRHFENNDLNIKAEGMGFGANYKF
jgi:opacity protein-like surface antigen